MAKTTRWPASAANHEATLTARLGVQAVVEPPGRLPHGDPDRLGVDGRVGGPEHRALEGRQRTTELLPGVEVGGRLGHRGLGHPDLEGAQPGPGPIEHPGQHRRAPARDRRRPAGRRWPTATPSRWRWGWISRLVVTARSMRHARRDGVDDGDDHAAVERRPGRAPGRPRGRRGRQRPCPTGRTPSGVRAWRVTDGRPGPSDGDVAGHVGQRGGEHRVAARPRRAGAAACSRFGSELGERHGAEDDGGPQRAPVPPPGPAPRGAGPARPCRSRRPRRPRGAARPSRSALASSAHSSRSNRSSVASTSWTRSGVTSPAKMPSAASATACLLLVEGEVHQLVLVWRRSGRRPAPAAGSGRHGQGQVVVEGLEAGDRPACRWPPSSGVMPATLATSRVPSSSSTSATTSG